jgi:hypothetical protein
MKSLAHCYAIIRKAYSLEHLLCPFRRALPYANMCKGFALKIFV